jgi:hypothetical protein
LNYFKENLEKTYGHAQETGLGVDVGVHRYSLFDVLSVKGRYWWVM